MDAVQSVPKRSTVPFVGLILMLLVTVIGGLVVGGIIGFISAKWEYIVLLFPLIMAAVGGWLLSWAVRTGKVRSSAVAVFFGLVIGVLTYGTYRYSNYYLERMKIHDDLVTQANNPNVTSADVEKAIDDGFKEKTGQTGFIGYTLLRAQLGVKLDFSSSYTSTSSPTDVLALSEPVTWAYWGVELLAVAFIPAVMARTAARKPFCEKDNRFYKLTSLGKVPKEAADPFVAAIKTGNLKQASPFIQRSKPRMKYPYLEVRVNKCPACNTNPVPMTIVRKNSSRNSGQKTVAKATLNPTQYSDLSGSVTA